MTSLQPYHYPAIYQRVLDETTGHELTVLHEDGLYRHLSYAKPGTGIWRVDVVTWPGHLAVTGDIGDGYVFRREQDMLTFFDHGQPDGWINPGYWAEKLTRGQRSVLEFSEDKFRKWLNDYGAGPAADDDLDVDSVDDAVDYCNARDIPWDCDTVEQWEGFSVHFLLAAHALLIIAKKYHSATAHLAA